MGDHKEPVSEEYLLKRYNGVIHLVTAANGAVKFYKHGNTTDDSGNKVFRKESPAEAIALDEAMKTSWAAHPNHIVIENEGTFAEKLDGAADAVMRIAHQAHPEL